MSQRCTITSITSWFELSELRHAGFYCVRSFGVPMPCVSTCRANCKILRIKTAELHHHNPDKIAVFIVVDKVYFSIVQELLVHDPYAHARKHSLLCVLHHAAMALVSVTAAVGTSFLGTWVPGMDT